MKKQLSFLLICTVVSLLVGCTSPSLKDSANFYYKPIGEVSAKNSDVIKAERREIDGVRNDIMDLISVYLQGPLDDSLESPFPKNTSVEKCTQMDDTLILILSPEFAELTGVDLTVACAALTKTVTELFPIQRVNFQTRNALLNGEHSITMSKNGMQLVDDALERLTSDVMVYYSDAQRRYLVGQEISVNLAEDIDLVEHLIYQLQNPPKNSELLSPLPEGTRLLGTSIENKICKINFSSEFDHKVMRSPQVQRLSLMSVVNTLTQLPEIEYVQFYIDGNLVTQYRSLSITEPMAWDDRAIGPVRNGLNEFDASLYLVNGTNEYLIEVPTRIRQSAGSSKAEMIVSALINYEQINDFESPIPKNATVNSVTISGTSCYVDFGSTFINDKDMVQNAVRSVIASVSALPDITQVFVTVNGTIPQGDLASHFLPTSPSQEWFP